MPKFIVGARLHDYGKGSPDELFGRVAADGFAAVQLAYKKCVPSVRSYADVTDGAGRRDRRRRKGAQHSGGRAGDLRGAGHQR